MSWTGTKGEPWKAEDHQDTITTATPEYDVPIVFPEPVKED